MKYNLLAVPTFRKELKRLSKKYASLKSDLIILFESLEVKPNQGIYIGYDCYKIRIAISSKGKGKSGGARIITHIMVSANTVFLLSIYDKSEKENLTDKELKDLLKNLSDET